MKAIKFLMIFILAFSIFCVSNQNILLASSTESKTWVIDKNVKQMSTADLNDVAYGNKVFVAVGDDGVIKISQDGIKWAFAESGTQNGLYGISWNGQRFVAVGDKGTIITSTEGTKWTPCKSKVNAYLSDVTWNGSKFVVVGYCTIISSTDGVNWVVCADEWELPIEVGILKSIVWNGKTFVAAGGIMYNFYFSRSVMVSADGDDWDIVICSDYLGPVNSVVWDGRQFIAGGGFSGSLRSLDGKKWVERKDESRGRYNCIAYNRSRYVAVGEDGRIMFSKYGLKWVDIHLTNKLTLNSVIYAQGKFVAVGNSGIVAVSMDGQKWMEYIYGINLQFNNVIFGNNMLVAIGYQGIIMTSMDGYVWTKRESATKSDLKICIYGDGKFLIYDRDVFLCSKDGIEWSPVKHNLHSGVQDIIWDGKKYMAVGNNYFSDAPFARGYIYTSTDGIEWESDELKMIGPENIVWNGDIYVGISGDSTYVSSDGVTWISRNAGCELKLNSVVWGKNRFVAVGSDYTGLIEGPLWTIGKIYTSEDGYVWEEVKVNGCEPLNDISFNGDEFVAVGDNGEIITSTNGVDWKIDGLKIDNSLRSIVWDTKQFIIVGSHGTIIRSKS